MILKSRMCKYVRIAVCCTNNKLAASGDNADNSSDFNNLPNATTRLNNSARSRITAPSQGSISEFNQPPHDKSYREQAS